MSKQRHGIVCASYLMPLKNNKILLLRRSNTGYEDGKYSLIAGHVEEGESVLQTLIRETKEEADLIIEESDVKLAHVMHRRKTRKTTMQDERIDFFFECRSWKGEPKIMETDKCDDLKWFGVDELPENVIPYIAQAINLANKGKPYSELSW